tara:strand:- start:283 stop:522 length:240 start_codon:yes stop_codon:yes gene_type:complete
MLKSKVDPFGLVFKDKKKTKVVPRTAEQLKKDTTDAESTKRREESAARLRSHRATNVFPTVDDGVITSPGTRSSKLFGE